MDEHTAIPGGGMGRRAFLGGLATAALPLAFGESEDEKAQPGRAGVEAKEPAFPGMITRQKNPDNLEFPFASLNSFLTRNEQFYVRTHFEVPELDAKTWRLKIEGSVERPVEIGYDELRQMPSRTVTALLECSGNSRVLLKPPQVGLRWEQGGVGNAEWTGVPLAEVLKRAGVKDAAVEVVLAGSDKGKFDPPDQKTPGVIPFARSLPVKKAKQPEVLLAYQMNGKELPPEHGHPVRVVVPGWYGMASVKWLKRLLVVDRPFRGFFQTFTYTIWERRGGLADLVPVTETQVKAQIARPAFGEVLPADSRYRVFGAAWTGEGEVAKVEVSTDGGKRWSEAKLLDKPVRYAWRLWEFEWHTPAQPGRHALLARATDDQGHVQPLERDDDRRDAMISHVQQIKVEVR
jgi:DMSO/TMAO reductase YedYZ molybdopterin-dependent catalytic subunit